MTKKAYDEGDNELRRILEAMLESNETISARAAARDHPALANASAITRNPSRRKLVLEYKVRQENYRKAAKRVPERSRKTVAQQLEALSDSNSHLKQQVRSLVSSHLTLIKVVGELGGMAKMAAFYNQYKEVRDDLAGAEALPKASIRPIKGAS